jgi:hypothetical protein
MRTPLALTVLVIAARPALGAPPYPLDGLLRRARVVFIGAASAEKGAITFTPTKVLRGTPPRPARFQTDGEPELARVDRFLVLSQGDDHYGPPTSHAALGQPLDGQASYTGWIVLAIQRDGRVDGAFLVPRTGSWVEVHEKDLPAIVARSPFRPPNP